LYFIRQKMTSLRLSRGEGVFVYDADDHGWTTTTDVLKYSLAPCSKLCWSLIYFFVPEVIAAL